MKQVMSEKLQYRLIGLAVVISLGVILAPLLINNSARLHHNMMLAHVAMPTPPQKPEVYIPKQSEIVKKLALARVAEKEPSRQSTVTSSAKPGIQQTTQTQKAIPDSQISAINFTVKTQQMVSLTEQNKKISLEKEKSIKKTVSQQIHLAEKKPPMMQDKNREPVRNPMARVEKKQLIKKAQYTIQLAVLTKRQNAQTLVSQLQQKGFDAKLRIIKGKQGAFYKVLVNTPASQQSALQVQKQLADTVHLNGFIIKHGVS